MRARLMLAMLLAAILGVASVAGAADWRDSVDPWVLRTAGEGTTEFLVVLAEQADLAPAEALEDKEAKGRFVVDALREAAERTQGPVLAELKSLGVEHRPYWISNMIWVRGGIDAVRAMAGRDDVARVSANPRVRLDEPVATGGEDRPTESVEWNIAHVNAPDVWALGVTGQGVVVAGQDTGYLWNHPALVHQYRGGPAGDHDYNWWDAIHSGGGSCGADSPEPCDDHGHGTHTMGTVVGDDGGSNQVGMAPGARWIGCRNMDVGVGTPQTYAECYQFFIAPTDLSGANPDPSLAPDVINNSWGCPPSEGCTDPNVLLSVVQAVRAAGIVTVHSAGNSGSSCSSVEDPSAIYAESFTVGSTDSTDDISYFSSRGPVTVDGSNRRKPDVVAPGESIRSSTRDGGYQGGWQGTSMAGPHVAGAVALLVSANPGIAGDVDLIESIVEQTAAPLTTSQGCGDDGPSDVPNNTYGWGRIDAFAAASFPLDFTLAPDPASVAVCAPDEATVEIVIGQHQGFDEPVTLAAVDLPAGAVASFLPNPVTPPGISTLTISGTDAVAPGTHPIGVVGTSSPSSIVHETSFNLGVYDGAPDAPAPAEPADGAVDVVTLPTLRWGPVAQGAAYVVEVATDPSFATVVATAQVDEAEYTLTSSLEPDTPYWWRVRAANPCGDGPWSAVWGFTTRAIPPILLVDDDDNDPDVRATYTGALDALGRDHDVWDTGNADVEPSPAELGVYEIVIWFTGDEFGGHAGPGAAGETALAEWLDGGDRCLLLSSQDYHWDRDLTPFMQSHLGVASVEDDEYQDTATGVGTPFAGLGPYALDYPFGNWSDILTPGAGGSAVFDGEDGPIAVAADLGTSKTSYWAFPFEALPTAAAREEALAAFLDWCVPPDAPMFADGFETGDTTAWSLSVP